VRRGRAGHAAGPQLTLALVRAGYGAKTELFNYEVTPVLDLSVNPVSQTSVRVLLEAASLDGSAAVQQQSQRFRPSATHTLSWEREGDTVLLTSSVELAMELAMGGALGFLPSVVQAPGSVRSQRFCRN